MDKGMLQSEKVLEFITFCVEMYAKKHHVSGRDVALLFEKNGVMKYLAEGYDVLHTQGESWLLQDISSFLEKRERKQ